MQNTILLADDDVELSDLLKEYFESEGFAVRVAHDGEQALDQARQPGLDLMVLDIMMPKMDGYETCKALKADEATRLRQRDVVMLVLGDPGPLSCDGVLTADGAEWIGLGDGHGHLQHRRTGFTHQGGK